MATANKVEVKKKYDKPYDNSNDVGAAWVKAKGISIQISKDLKKDERIFAFPNKSKTEEKHPDYRLVRFPEKEE